MSGFFERTIDEFFSWEFIDLKLEKGVIMSYNN